MDVYKSYRLWKLLESTLIAIPVTVAALLFAVFIHESGVRGADGEWQHAYTFVAAVWSNAILLLGMIGMLILQKTKRYNSAMEAMKDRKAILHVLRVSPFRFENMTTDERKQRTDLILHTKGHLVAVVEMVKATRGEGWSPEEENTLEDLRNGFKWTHHLLLQQGLGVSVSQAEYFTT